MLAVWHSGFVSLIFFASVKLSFYTGFVKWLPVSHSSPPCLFLASLCQGFAVSSEVKYYNNHRVMRSKAAKSELHTPKLRLMLCSSLSGGPLFSSYLKTSPGMPGSVFRLFFLIKLMFEDGGDVFFKTQINVLHWRQIFTIRKLL